jgi:small subunit ribosomal protein S6
MAFYECVYMARPDVSPTQVEAITEQITTIVTEYGGSVHSTEYWGLKSLAYRVKKNRKAHYVLMNIDMNNEGKAEMERNMALNEDVLRMMTLRIEEMPEGQSIQMRAKARGDRPDRGDRGDRGGDRGGERRERRDAE